jgi:hypothetical protein
VPKPGAGAQPACPAVAATATASAGRAAGLEAQLDRLFQTEAEVTQLLHGGAGVARARPRMAPHVSNGTQLLNLR